MGDIPFPIGAALYKVVGATLVALNATVTAISGNKQITVSPSIDGVWNTSAQIWNTSTSVWDIANVSDGDTIVVLGNGAIEGDQMRDYYLKIRLSNNDTNETEMYAVNAIFSKSNLHNELGQQ